MQVHRLAGIMFAAAPALGVSFTAATATQAADTPLHYETITSTDTPQATAPAALPWRSSAARRR